MTAVADRPAAGRLEVVTSAPGYRGDPSGLRWTAGGLVLGALLALCWWTVQPASWNSTAGVVVTGVDGEGRGSLFEINGSAQDAVATVASIAESDVVADGVARTLGLPARSLRGSVTAEARAGTLFVDVRVTQTRAARLVEVTNAVATTTSEQTQILQALNAGTVRTRVDVVTGASDPADGHRHGLGFVLVIGLVLGAAAGALGAVLRRPLPGRLRESTWDLDAEIRAELAVWRSTSRRRDVRLSVVLALLALIGHAATGSPAPLLLLGVVLAAAAVRDLRWPAVGLLLLGLGAPSPRVTLLPLGVLTLSVQDVLLLAGVAGVVWRWWRGRGPSAVVERSRTFAPAVLALTAAIACGGLVGLVRGADHTDLAGPVRVLLVLPATYLIVRRAFARRAAQLLLVLLGCSFVSSSLVLLAVPLGWDALLSDVRDHVVTGTSSAPVTRLSDPVLVVWSVLLVVLAGGVASGTRRWIWWVAALPGVVHVALSSDRSTWGPLIVIVILAAGLRGGLLGLLRRGVLILVVGGIGLTTALSGSVGFQAQQLGDRALSAVTGAATQENSLTDRLVEDAAAVATLESDPVLGTGLGHPYGGLIVVFDPSQDATVVVPRPFIHNQYFRLWLLLGVPGLAAMAWLLVRMGSATALLTRGVGTRRAAVPVAVALGVLCTGLQGISQTNLIDRPTMVLAGLSFALIEICVRSCLSSAPAAPVPPAVRESA